MRTFMILAALAVCAPVLADTPKPERDRRSADAVLRVSIGTEHATGIVISKQGWVVTTAHFVDMYPSDSAIIVHDDGQKDVSRNATVVALDRGLDLALLRTDGSLPTEAFFSNRLPSPKQLLTAYAYVGDFGRRRIESRVSACNNVRYDPPGYRTIVWEKAVLIDYLPEPGAIGAGVFSQIDGGLVGIMVGRSDPSDEKALSDKGVIAPSSALRTFLEANDVTVTSVPKPAAKKKN